MIKIYVWEKSTPGDKRLLHLDPDSSFTFKMSNPFVSDLGTFSYPVTVDYYKNKDVFDFPGEGESIEKEFFFDMYVGSEFFISGEVEIIDAEGIEISLKSGKSGVARALKESFLDEKINGEDWGIVSSPNFDGSLNHSYPSFNYVAPPIKWKEGIFNKSSDGVIDQSTLCPAVYVRYLIYRIVGALGYVIRQDAVADIPDSHRLFIWCARENVDPNDMSTWLPHITAFDFLKDIEKRLGIFVFFHPQKRYCDILSINDILDLQPEKLTHKFISKEDSEPYKKKNIIITQEGKDDDVINPDKLTPSITVQSYFDLPDINPTPSESNDDILSAYEDDEIVAKVDGDPPRYFRKTEINPDNSFPADEQELVDSNEGVYLTKQLYTYYSDYDYYMIDPSRPEDEDPIEESNSDTTPAQMNRITQFLFPTSIMSGKINEFFGLTIHAKASGATAGLVVEVTTPQDEVVGRGATTVDNVDYEVKKMIFRMSRSMKINGRFGQVYGGCRVNLYAISYEGQAVITVKFGGIDDSKTFPIAPHFWIDPKYYQWKEIAAFGEYEWGDGAEKLEIDLKGNVLKNEFVTMKGVFELPVTEMEPSLEQENFAYSIYRGWQYDQTFNMNTRKAGYANFDTKYLKLSDYSSDIDGDTPELALRLPGTDGIVKKILEKILYRKHHRWRKVTDKLDLSITDIANQNIFTPVLIGAQVYLISSLSIPVKISGEIDAVTAELVTI